MTPLYGVFAGIVVSAGDPQRRGRARVQIPQLLGLEVAGWARPVVAGGVLPGDQVMVAFEGGDVHSPVFWPKLRSVAEQWIALPYNETWAPVSAATLGPAMVRLSGSGDIELAGGIRPTFEPVLGSEYTVTTLTAPLRPVAAVNLQWCAVQQAPSAGVNPMARVSLGGDGVLKILLPEGLESPFAVCLNGFTARAV